MNWESSTKHFMAYPKGKAGPEEGGQAMSEFHHRGKRRASHHSSDHDLEDQINEWANMTGFLCALGGVCLQRKSPARGPMTSASTLSLDSRKSSVLTSQDMQYCPVTQ